MNDELKKGFLAKLEKMFGKVRRLEGTQSLYEIGRNNVRIYIRYSSVHETNRTFYGLRQEDLRQLEGRRSFMCFLWEEQREPLILPFADYEDVFHETTPASDGQYKVQIYLREDSTDFYLARAGRFNVDAYFGWSSIERAGVERETTIPDLSHPQIQTLLGAIGVSKKYDIWIPLKDRDALDWSIAERFRCLDKLPRGYEGAQSILQEIDTVWVERGSIQVRALYEVEHSTPVYSGLLRFNDVRLLSPSVDRYAIVSNETRRSLFVKQLNRPTFQRSGLSDICTFLEYTDVFEWYHRIRHNR